MELTVAVATFDERKNIVPFEPSPAMSSLFTWTRQG
jgi:hypothetical protein